MKKNNYYKKTVTIHQSNDFSRMHLGKRIHLCSSWRGRCRIFKVFNIRPWWFTDKPAYYILNLWISRFYFARLVFWLDRQLDKFCSYTAHTTKQRYSNSFQGKSLSFLRQTRLPTFQFHSHLKTFLEPTVRTPLPLCLVNRARLILYTCVTLLILNRSLEKS